ncbi:hypothetical protein [Azospira sp. I09]|uniref:hypothetical protein n=1 Tax=Azospira sp. I09 TaxID=1765049 RepID=UPI001260DA7A|nr:hypothetical protein [Azospira sp. I09]BBN87399.1 hypothetical protein AZSP09_04220 [Azospira sp. I09]
MRLTALLTTAIARGLLAVMLAGFLTPTFGWEMVSAAAPHDHAAVAEHHHGDQGAHDSLQHTQHDQDCAPQHHTAGDDGQGQPGHHHCCAGHVFGHLIGLTADATLPAAAGKDVRRPLSLAHSPGPGTSPPPLLRLKSGGNSR